MKNIRNKFDTKPAALRQLYSAVRSSYSVVSSAPSACAGTSKTEKAIRSNKLTTRRCVNNHGCDATTHAGGTQSAYIKSALGTAAANRSASTQFRPDDSGLARKKT